VRNVLAGAAADDRSRAERSLAHQRQRSQIGALALARGVRRPVHGTWLSPSSYRWLFTSPRGPNGTWAEPLKTLQAEQEALQFLQAEAYRYIYQSNRRARWHRSAVAIFTLELASDHSCECHGNCCHCRILRTKL